MHTLASPQTLCWRVRHARKKAGPADGFWKGPWARSPVTGHRRPRICDFDAAIFFFTTIDYAGSGVNQDFEPKRCLISRADDVAFFWSQKDVSLVGKNNFSWTETKLSRLSFLVWSIFDELACFVPPRFLWNCTQKERGVTRTHRLGGAFPSRNANTVSQKLTDIAFRHNSARIPWGNYSTIRMLLCLHGSLLCDDVYRLHRGRIRRWKHRVHSTPPTALLQTGCKKLGYR